jgi:hypothetical protein
MRLGCRPCPCPQIQQKRPMTDKRTCFFIVPNYNHHFCSLTSNITLCRCEYLFVLLCYNFVFFVVSY